MGLNMFSDLPPISASSRFLYPRNVVDIEDYERYKPGGFHPVHLGDLFDEGRYKIVNKLGASKYATVWLARDLHEMTWASLKIVQAQHSAAVGEAAALTKSILRGARARLAQPHERDFTVEGPNGCHLCLVLPAIGPALSGLANITFCRLTASFARAVGKEATRAVAELHSAGLCHGDLTTRSFIIDIPGLDDYDEEGLLRVFGDPIMGELETVSGEAPGPEAPRYIVNSMNFMFTSLNLLSDRVRIVDFDRCFSIFSPPATIPDTSLEFLAPEVAVGEPPSATSDVWALGCCLFQFRSGFTPFINSFDVMSPETLVSYLGKLLPGEEPPGWQNTLWDHQGRATKDMAVGRKSTRLLLDETRSLGALVYDIYDDGMTPNFGTGVQDEYMPFRAHFSDTIWNPNCPRQIDSQTLGGKIALDEAALLLDLLFKIFVLDPAQRTSVQELYRQPWFHMADIVTALESARRN